MNLPMKNEPTKSVTNFCQQLTTFTNFGFGYARKLLLVQHKDKFCYQILISILSPHRKLQQTVSSVWSVGKEPASVTSPSSVQSALDKQRFSVS